MNLAAAQTLAIRALGFLAADADLLGRFLAETGLGPDELRANADDPSLLAGVLDFLLGNEKELVAFCEAEGIAPDRPRRARALLPGYTEPM